MELAAEWGAPPQWVAWNAKLPTTTIGLSGIIGEGAGKYEGDVAATAVGVALTGSGAVMMGASTEEEGEAGEREARTAAVPEAVTFCLPPPWCFPWPWPW